MNNPGQKTLPNSTAALVLGILSIPTCICYGILGMLLGIIAIVLYNQDKKRYDANKMLWTTSSYNNLVAGKVCGIIGLCISLLYLIVLLFVWGAILDKVPFEDVFMEIEKHW